MSLYLRQAGQVLLNEYGLNEYHVSMDQYKCLVVLDDDNEELIRLRGVQFTKLAPTKKEINFALELLDKFIVKHWLTAKAFLDKKAAFKAKDTVPNMAEKGKFIVHVPSTGYQRDERYTLVYKDSFFVWTFTLEDDLTLKVKSCNTLDGSSISTPQQLTEYKFDERECERGYNHLMAFKQQNEEKIELEKLRKSLFKNDA